MKTKYYKVFTTNGKYIGVTMSGLITDWQAKHGLLLVYDGKSSNHVKRSESVMFEITETLFDQLSGMDKFIPMAI